MTFGGNLKSNPRDFVVAAILSTLAIALTYYVAPFKSIPWTASLFVVAFVAEIGGVAPALLATMIAVCGVYRLILAPSSRFYNPVAVVETAAFIVTALF